MNISLRRLEILKVTNVSGTGLEVVLLSEDKIKPDSKYSGDYIEISFSVARQLNS
jgi:hypothetical protein